MSGGYIEKSLKADDKELSLVNQFTRRPFEADELYLFSVILCDNDVDRDFEKFTPRALEELAELFIGKTGLFDHSMKSGDQTARIYKTWVEKQPERKTADGECYYCLKAGAYMVRTPENEALITQIDAGIKKEVSVSCTMHSAVCSICGADRRKSRCGHVPGGEYDGKTAVTVLSEAGDAYEWSFVAVPAQRGAGVIKSYNTVKGEFDLNEVVKSLQTCGDTVTLSKKQAHQLADYVDSLEQEAQLGKTYKKNLVRDVVSLCAKNMPQMELKVFESVAGVMTAKELQAFKEAFQKMQSQMEIKPQLARREDRKENNTPFLI